MEKVVTTRSHWQILAAKKYPRLLFIGGDGEWLVMTKCPHAQTTHWRYALRASYAEAVTLMSKWDMEGCTYGCEGFAQHSLWRMRDY